MCVFDSLFSSLGVPADDNIDTEEQKKKFAENPKDLLKYSKEIESELNQRFKFILNGTPEAEASKAVGDQAV